jgi:hypothetical protein
LLPVSCSDIGCFSGPKHEPLAIYLLVEGASEMVIHFSWH